MNPNDECEFVEARSRLEAELVKRINNTSRKLRSLQFSLQECMKWSVMYHEGLLLQANLYRWQEGASALIVEDWEKNNELREIALTPPLSRQKEISKRFSASKRQRQGIAKIEAEIAKIEPTRAFLLLILKELTLAQVMPELLIIKKKILRVVKPSVRTQELKSSPYRTFNTAAGLQILVGKKAQDNETLTFKVAHGSDFWLHVQGASGAHVVIKTLKGAEPDEESLQDALQLALFYSKAKSQGYADVVVTQQKYVSRFGKGSKNCGKVQVSKHRVIAVKLDPKRLERLHEH